MSEDIRQGWKLFTHDWRSPIRGGEPVCDGTFPMTLSPVRLHVGPADCGAGWNYVVDIPTGGEIWGT